MWSGQVPGGSGIRHLAARSSTDQGADGPALASMGSPPADPERRVRVDNLTQRLAGRFDGGERRHQEPPRL